MKALILIAAFLMGCAIAIGDNSRAHVNTEAQREVAKDSATIEDVLKSQKEKVK